MFPFSFSIVRYVSSVNNPSSGYKALVFLINLDGDKLEPGAKLLVTTNPSEPKTSVEGYNFSIFPVNSK